MQTLEILSDLVKGFGTTALLFFVTLVFSLPLGLLISFGSLSRIKPIRWLTKGLVWVIRGTPLMLQILAVSLIPNYLFGLPNKKLMVLLGIERMSDLLLFFVIIAFVINYACYFSEIFRGGIESIPRGQYEAGAVLGMKKSQVFFKVILLQVVKRTLAPVSNEVITLVKDTALAQVLGVVEMFTAAKMAVNHYVIFTPLLYAGLFYLLANGLLTLLFGVAEKKLAYFKE
ncbi:MAG: amino acid ABC transporter permease [Ruminococcus sp.]|nr:amino acid ABC transporter permease [Candidatus Apopatosoma intestinale]